jgi:hypothetical protein
MVISLIGGFGAGIVASYVVWFLIARFHIPRIEVSRICRDFRSQEPVRYRYRIKVRNPNSRRSIGDLTLAARLVIQGLDESRPTAYTAFRLQLADAHPFPVLEPGEGRIYTFHLTELEADGRAHLPAHIRFLLDADDLLLEELMQLGTEAFLRFAVSGSHEVGGLYRTVIRRFTSDDVVSGSFQNQETVEIEPSEDPVVVQTSDTDASEPTGLA